tara:strand:- start:86 stop:241 length:156 start_codon:yes stop_codon:yes gene_type:complete
MNDTNLKISGKIIELVIVMLVFKLLKKGSFSPIKLPQLIFSKFQTITAKNT